MSECPRLERTHLLADGELSPGDAEEARAHLATCAICQAELAEIVQLDLAVAAAPAQRPAPVVSLAWYRRRIVQLGALVLTASAAAAVLVLVKQPPRNEPGVEIALAPHRALEARLSWGDAAAYRPYDVPRSGDERRRESIPLGRLAELEDRGDLHGVGVVALLDGERGQAAAYLARAGETTGVLADRGALALESGKPEEALRLLDTALSRSPGDPVAVWNRALALRELGLSRAAAAAFRDVAAHREPGWAEEAASRATALEVEIDARHDRAMRVWAAMRTLAADGTGLTVQDVRELPGMSQLVLYDAMRAAPSAERLAVLAPLFDALGADARATLARAKPRPALAATYAAIIAGAPPVGAARERHLVELRAARADELLIGALIKLSPDGHTVQREQLPELARLAAASPDPWFQLLGLEQEAAILLSTDLSRAEEILLRARARCGEASAPTYRCLKIARLLAQVYRDSLRLPEERAVLAEALSRARRDGEWFIELQLLAEHIEVESLGDDVEGSGLPLVAAYAEEVRLRSRDPGMCRQVVWTRVMTAMTLINRLRFADARRELEAAPACEPAREPAAAAQELFVRAHVVRETGSDDELAALRADIARVRLDTAASPTVSVELDHIEGRALIDRDRSAAEALLRRAIATARALPQSDATARKASAWSYAVLAIAAARHGEGDRALALLAEEQGLAVPPRCVLGLALDDQRRVAVVRDPRGATRAHYDEARTTTALDPQTLVPRAIADALEGCAVVDVIARSPIHGTPRVLPDTLAWRYLSPRLRPLGSTSDRELVVADVQPPPSLALPRLTSRAPQRGDVIAGAAATPDRVLAAIADAGIATIHAHGLVDLGRADASFLALSPDATGRFALTAGDIRAVTFRTSPLVILAACRASRAAPVLHETWSLPVAFIRAGARAVIASASPIPDGEAEAFFAEVRRRIDATTPIGVAVRDARAAWLSGRRGGWVRDIIVFE
ncbi:MAG: CHAT domain-containing protein [Deltaproteobacteria bacterium]|nr:CHAT domain-containing protein [Deltaproteobacteria bacterium]